MSTAMVSLAPYLNTPKHVTTADCVPFKQTVAVIFSKSSTVLASTSADMSAGLSVGLASNESHHGSPWPSAIAACLCTWSSAVTGSASTMLLNLCLVWPVKTRQRRLIGPLCCIVSDQQGLGMSWEQES